MFCGACYAEWKVINREVMRKHSEAGVKCESDARFEYTLVIIVAKDFF